MISGASTKRGRAHLFDLQLVAENKRRGRQRQRKGRRIEIKGGRFKEEIN
jgi:hypothetical protein